MSIVYVTNVVVAGNNPAAMSDAIELEISFECLEPLQEDLEWKLVYVGSAEDKTKDQELDSIVLGPIQRGALRFTFTVYPPDYAKIKKEDLSGITVILLSASYRHQEFVRVGWFVHNFFYEEQFAENPPDLDAMTIEEMLPRMKRYIIADNPRVTRFNIDWDTPNTETPMFVTDGGVTDSGMQCGTSTGMPFGTPTGTPGGMPFGIPAGTPGGVPFGTSSGTLAGVSFGTSFGTPAGMPFGSSSVGAPTQWNNANGPTWDHPNGALPNGSNAPSTAPVDTQMADDCNMSNSDMYMQIDEERLDQGGTQQPISTTTCYQQLNYI